MSNEGPRFRVSVDYRNTRTALKRPSRYRARILRPRTRCFRVRGLPITTAATTARGSGGRRRRAAREAEPGGTSERYRLDPRAGRRFLTASDLAPNAFVFCTFGSWRWRRGALAGFLGSPDRRSRARWCLAPIGQKGDLEVRSVGRKFVATSETSKSRLGPAEAEFRYRHRRLPDAPLARKTSTDGGSRELRRPFWKVALPRPSSGVSRASLRYPSRSGRGPIYGFPLPFS